LRFGRRAGDGNAGRTELISTPFRSSDFSRLDWHGAFVRARRALAN
jgi:hypothetical protein